jgi:hypothetical protein
MPSRVRLPKSNLDEPLKRAVAIGDFSQQRILGHSPILSAGRCCGTAGQMTASASGPARSSSIGIRFDGQFRRRCGCCRALRSVRPGRHLATRPSRCCRSLPIAIIFD